MASNISTQFLFFSDGKYRIYNTIRSKVEFVKLFEFTLFVHKISTRQEETKFSKIHAPSFLPTEKKIYFYEKERKKRYINFPKLAVSSMWHRSTRQKFTFSRGMSRMLDRVRHLERSRLSFKAERSV